MTEPQAPTASADDRLPVLETAFPESAWFGRALARAGLTIAVAESCTGGLLGAVLTAAAGSSAYVRGGVIAYADDVKAEHLGVGRHLLATHGAVSPEVAAAMASGVRAALRGDPGRRHHRRGRPGRERAEAARVGVHRRRRSRRGPGDPACRGPWTRAEPGARGPGRASHLRRGGRRELLTGSWWGAVSERPPGGRWPGPGFGLVTSSRREYSTNVRPTR